MKQRITANNNIRAREVRLIGQEGQQFGIVSLQEAIRKAREANSDLIQVTEKVDPPVCKIMDYGKYAYQLGKKERKVKQQKAGEVKSIRLSFNISQHDLETRAQAAAKFMQKGYKIRIEMRLSGREKGLTGFAREKIKKFLEILNSAVPIKIEKDLKQEPRGMTLMVIKQ